MISAARPLLTLRHIIRAHVGAIIFRLIFDIAGVQKLDDVDHLRNSHLIVDLEHGGGGILILFKIEFFEVFFRDDMLRVNDRCYELAIGFDLTNFAAKA